MNPHKHKLQNELKNLPTWEAPDVFLDVTENENDNEGEDDSGKNMLEDICDIYNDSVHFFNLNRVQGQKTTIDEIVPIISGGNAGMKRSLSKRFRNSIRRKFRKNTEKKSVQNTDKKSSPIVKYFRHI